MGDLLWVGVNHISKRINDQDYKPFRLRSHTHYEPHPSILPLLEQAGFGEVIKIRSCRLDQHLCTAMVERWRPETHTFHLPSGECTITLEDVSMLLGLKIDGLAVTGSTENNILTQYSVPMLGKNPEDIPRDGSTLYLTWLKQELDRIPDQPTHEQRLQYFRLYLLHFIGGFLMPESSGSRVHIKYLPLLQDPATVRSYSWGSACLAALYRGLCAVANTAHKHPPVTAISGCCFLLQAWARYRITCLTRTRIIDAPDGPIALEVLFRGTEYNNNPSHDVVSMRDRIDRMAPNNFIWRPYLSIADQAIEDDTRCWSATTYLICFEIVEYHQTDRVKLQFGFKQNQPERPQKMSKYHKVNRRGQKVDLWNVEYENEIQDWNNRHHKVLNGRMADPAVHSNNYLEWFRRKFNPYLIINPPQPHHPASPQDFTPIQSPMQTTTQHQAAEYADYTPAQFQIHDHQTFNSPTTSQFHNQQNFYQAYPQHNTEPTQQSQNQQDYYAPTTLFTSPAYTQPHIIQTPYQPAPNDPQAWANAILFDDDNINNMSFSEFARTTAGLSFSEVLNDARPSSSNPTGPVQYEEDDDDDEEQQRPQGRQQRRRGSRIRRHRGCGTGSHL